MLWALDESLGSRAFLFFLFLLLSLSFCPFLLCSYPFLDSHSDTKTRGLHLMRSIFGRLLICFSLRKARAKCQVRSKNHKNAAVFVMCSAAEQCTSRFDGKCRHVQTKHWAELQNHGKPKGTIRGKRRLLDTEMTAQMELEMKLKLKCRLDR